VHDFAVITAMREDDCAAFGGLGFVLAASTNGDGMRVGLENGGG
jgi:hypothetical protein